MNIPWNELVDRFHNAEKLFEMVKDLDSKKSEYANYISGLKEYALSLQDSRGASYVSSNHRITVYENLDPDSGMNSNDIEKAINDNFKHNFETLRKTIHSNNTKVLAICSELELIQNWTINTNPTNFTDMKEYQSKLSNRPNCFYKDYPPTNYTDESLLLYAERLEEDYEKSISILPEIYNQLDNVRVTLKQKGKI